MAEGFFEKIQNVIISQKGIDSPKLWPPFPGFQATFYSHLPSKPTQKFQVDAEKLVSDSTDLDPNKRAYEVVNQYLEGIRHLMNTDDRIDTIVCVVPDIIYENCRPKSYIKDGVGERISSSDRKNRAIGQTELLASLDLSMYKYSVDFRRQLKARALKEKIEAPIQIVLESTLANDDDPLIAKIGKTPLSDRAWNICTTLFYKAGGKPWRLSTARNGVCYVGVVFHRTDPAFGNKYACCAAQMFLDSGDGVVIRGDMGPWFSPKDGEFHLSKQAAKDLLTEVLTTYQELEGKPLNEVFLHYKAGINFEEYQGFRSACPSKKVVCIKIRQEPDQIRLYREGRWPVLRGTFLKISDKRGYLWTTGFKPFLGTYDGWEIPVPLRIDLQYGDSDLDQVATDILGLTKLNFNECKYGDSTPVTIGFSNAVGEILVSNPTIKKVNPKFKYYI